MIELKPRCAGCGTGNAIDAVFCQECGVGLNTEESVNDIDIMSGQDAPYMKSLKQGSCIHETTVQYHRCKCATCIRCNKRTETCFEHTSKFDYGLQTKKKNSLDHLREKDSKFIVKDKRLDFRSNQIPDWEFSPHIPTETMKPPFGGIFKMPNASHEEIRHFMEAYKGEMEKYKKDPNYIPLMATNKNIEVVPFTTTSNLTPQPPYSSIIGTDRIPPISAIIGTDVRKGITPLREKSSGLDRPFPSREVPSRLAFATSPKWFLGLMVSFLPLIVILLYT